MYIVFFYKYVCNSGWQTFNTGEISCHGLLWWVLTFDACCIKPPIWDVRTGQIDRTYHDTRNSYSLPVTFYLHYLQFICTIYSVLVFTFLLLHPLSSFTYLTLIVNNRIYVRPPASREIIDYCFLCRCSELEQKSPLLKSLLLSPCLTRTFKFSDRG